MSNVSRTVVSRWCEFVIGVVVQVVKLMKKKGTSTALVGSAGAGDIVSIAGLSQPSIGHTISSIEVSSECVATLSFPGCEDFR